MNHRFLRHRLLPWAAAFLLAGAIPGSAKPALAGKLDALLRHPGDYSQICDAMQSSFPAPLPGFRSIMHDEAGFSEANLKFIKKNRMEILAAVAAKLEGLDLLRAPKPQPPDPSIKKDENGELLVDVDPIGTDPDTFSTLLLTIIEETDGIEVLPQLLAVEEKYYTLLTAAEKDPKAPRPQSDGGEGAGIVPGELLKEGEEYDKLTPEREAEIDRTRSLFYTQAVHRDMLAVCVRLMRKAGYEPMLESSLEKTYGKLLREKWGSDEELSKYKSAADIPAEDKDSIKYDPVHKVAYMAWQPVNIPFTPGIRTEIVTLTKSFVASRRKK